MKQLINKLYQLGIRVEANDGELQVKAPKGTLTTEIVQEIKRHKQELIDVLKTSETKIPKAPKQEYYPLTASQKRIWILSQFEGGSRAYNIFGAFEMNGQLDVKALEKAVQYLIQRHESLRTAFIEKDGDIWQQILPKSDINFKLEVIEVSTDEAVQVAKFYESEFDLTQAPLIKAQLIKITATRHLLLFAIHHSIGDGWSIEIFAGELIQCYNDLYQGKNIELPKLNIQYKDYALWMESDVMQQKLKKQETYWLSEFSGELPKLELPTYQPRPTINSYQGNTLVVKFPKDWFETLKKFIEKEEITLFMALMAGINSVLYRYSGNLDIILGIPTAGRSHSEVKNQIGLYLNTLAIRTQLQGKMSFGEMVQLQKEKLLVAYSHEEYPFDQLVQKLQLKRDTSRSALFDVMVVLQNQQNIALQEEQSFDGLTIKPYHAETPKVSLFDMSFSFAEQEGQLQLRLEYNTDLYQKTFIERLITHFQKLLSEGINQPEITLENITLIDTAEVETICSEFNHENTLLTHTKTVVEYIAENAVKNPNQKALVAANEERTYQELDQISNQIADYLEKTQQLKKNDFIGIALDGTPWTIMTILGVMKLGATYIPIDPNYPEARKKYIKTTSNCKIVIDESMLNTIKETIQNYSNQYISKAAQEDTAYVIFTSGSTGKPKGIPITHTSLIDYVKTFSEYFKITEKDSILQQASISFDTSMEEIYPILISGGTLIFHEEKTNFKALYELCESHNVTLLSTNPYALQYLNKNYQNFNLNFRALISGGDVLRMDYINSIYQHIPIYNTYGPTESTVCATYYKVTGNESIIPIGKPIENRQVYILATDSTHLMPIDVTGELCISGLGLTQGYLGNEALTKEKFIPHPFKKGETLYRTGDLAKWLPDGNLVFVGRKDTQVKLRGYRIELEEIENVAQQLEGVTQAVAIIKEANDESAIVLYWVETESGPTKTEIRHALTEKLPSYMIPSYYVGLESVPLNTHGKINRKALPQFNLEEGLTVKEYIAPRTTIEEKLAEIWQRTLGIEKVGVTHNFFELGGHSLLAIKLINEINQKFDKITFQIKNLFMNSTIESMAGLIAIAERKDTVINEVEDDDEKDTFTI